MMGNNNVKFAGFATPEENWSKLPHEFIRALPMMSSKAEIAIVLYILRHTWGYREYDAPKHITTDEFAKGRKRRDGTRIDGGVGMSEPAIRAGIKAAIGHGFILVEIDNSDKARVEKSYMLNMVGENNLPPISEGDSKEFTPGGKKSTLDQRKKPEERNIEENHSAPNGTDAAPPNGKAKTPRPPHKNAPWHDALVLAFSVTPDSLTKSADRTYWNAAAELAAVQFPVEQIPDLYRWCKGQGWKSFTVMALAKYAPTWLAERVNKPAPVATRYEYPTQAEIDTLTSPYGAAKFDANGRWIGETQEADYDGTRAAS